jgi:hypothetical protein
MGQSSKTTKRKEEPGKLTSPLWTIQPPITAKAKANNSTAATTPHTIQNISTNMEASEA